MWKNKCGELETRLLPMRDMDTQISLLNQENERFKKALDDRQQELDDWKSKFFDLQQRTQDFQGTIDKAKR